MATRTTVTMVDDLDGSPADEQIKFAFDGRTYEIDLSSRNSARLRDALAPFISAARRGTLADGPSTPATKPGRDRERNQAIREWAHQRGMKLSERGRIPLHVIRAFDRDH